MKHQTGTSVGAFEQLFSNPLRAIHRIILIVLLSLVFGLIVPAFVAIYCGVFTEADVLKTMRASHDPNLKAAMRKWDEYSIRQKEVARSLKDIDALLDPANNSLQGRFRLLRRPGFHDIQSLLAERTMLQTAWNSLTPPFKVRAFFLDTMMFVYPTNYCFLSILIFVLSPLPLSVLGSRQFLKKVVLLFVPLGFMYRWSTWIRNVSYFRNVDLGRHIYASSNIDVSRADFWFQEVQTLAICLLVAVLWVQLANYMASLKRTQEAGGHRSVDVLLGEDTARGLSQAFLHWQACSVLLILAFATYTYYFYENVIIYQDRRYLMHAFIVHMIWGLSWLLVTLPVIYLYMRWQALKVGAIGGLAQEPDRSKSEGNGQLLQAIVSIEPVSTWNGVISSFLSLASFIAPSIHSLWK